MARPRQLLERAGHGAFNVDLLGDVGPDNVAAVVPDQGAQGFSGCDKVALMPHTMASDGLRCVATA